MRFFNIVYKEYCIECSTKSGDESGVKFMLKARPVRNLEQALCPRTFDGGVLVAQLGSCI